MFIHTINSRVNTTFNGHVYLTINRCINNMCTNMFIVTIYTLINSMFKDNLRYQKTRNKRPYTRTVYCKYKCAHKQHCLKAIYRMKTQEINVYMHVLFTVSINMLVNSDQYNTNICLIIQRLLYT